MPCQPLGTRLPQADPAGLPSSPSGRSELLSPPMHARLVAWSKHRPRCPARQVNLVLAQTLKGSVVADAYDLAARLRPRLVAQSLEHLGHLHDHQVSAPSESHPGKATAQQGIITSAWLVSSRAASTSSITSTDVVDPAVAACTDGCLDCDTCRTMSLLPSRLTATTKARESRVRWPPDRHSTPPRLIFITMPSCT